MFPHISGLQNSTLSKSNIGILQSPLILLYLIYTRGYGYNTSHESIGKLLTYIIRVMQNIELAKSPYITIISPEKLVATIEKWIMTYQLSVNESPMVCSFILSVRIHSYFWDTFSYIARKHSFIMSGKVCIHCQEIQVKGLLTLITWYYLNPHCWNRLI